MVSSYQHNVLVVEDDSKLAGLMKAYADKLPPFARVDFVRSREEAVKFAQRKVYHFASIDQSLPDVEGEKIIQDNGLILCREFAEQSPLVMKAIYTNFGKTSYAQQVGSLDGTTYFEKSAADSDDKESYSVRTYMGSVIPDALSDYLVWALKKSRHHLPLAYAAPSKDIADYAVDPTGDRNRSAVVSDAINWIWEKTLWLSWAQACALVQAAGLEQRLASEPSPAGSAEYATRTLSSAWRWLGEAGWFRSWRKYITYAPEGAAPSRHGGAFLDASDVLRKFRNEGAHHARVAVAREDFDRIGPALLQWVDALAFWADHPFMLNPRFHHSDRKLIQYDRLAGAPPWPSATAESDLQLPDEASRRSHIFTRQKGPKGDVLVDMFPLITMVSRQGHPPEPAITIPSLKGAQRISLQDGGVLPVPMSREEAAAIRKLFGGKWRLQ